MASLTEFIEGRLRLKINQAKSAVARPEDRHFLGFRLRLDSQTGNVEVLLSVRTKRNAMGRIRDLTPRPWGRTLQACILEINAWVMGWHQFFRSCEPGEEYVLRALDAHIRRRLGAILLHHWKRRPTIVRNLIALGIKPRQAWQAVYSGRKSLWGAQPYSSAAFRALRPRYFTDRGLLLAGGAAPGLARGDRRADRRAAGPGAAPGNVADSSKKDQTVPSRLCVNSTSTVLWEPGRATAPATRRGAEQFGRGAAPG